MKKNKFAGVLLAFFTYMSMALALDFNQNITAIFGSGNPDTGWTVGTGEGITLALRAKNREENVVDRTANINGVYLEPVGFLAPNNNRARWNWEFSVYSGIVPLSTFDYYVEIDLDPSGCVNIATAEVLTYWNDNSYGDASTLNGQGLEGIASLYPEATVVQQSQNLVFAGGNPNLNATHYYGLYAVAKGAGPDGVRLAETSIVVIVGDGGDPCPDTDGDGVTDDTDECIDSDLRPSVDVNGPPKPKGNDNHGVTTVTNYLLPNGCTVQDLVNAIALANVKNGEYKKALNNLAEQLVGENVLTYDEGKALQHRAKIFVP